ncbi:hypothetical protein AYI68_g6199 [Smittium mucronatum]|uniref:Uncharacterized protein n=1 Tax=Smittium mucronatum TaxID=133383 RepID=A0A1R0GS85_9FUNG|nr:hypothetical protein AYI68_g6199 [Smittium mucronatum]
MISGLSNLGLKSFKTKTKSYKSSDYNEKIIGLIKESPILGYPNQTYKFLLKQVVLFKPVFPYSESIENSWSTTKSETKNKKAR